MDVIQFIPESLIALVCALYCLGIILKQTPTIKDWIIPYILMGFAIIGSVALKGFNAEAIISGIIASFCAIGTNQIIKQSVARN